MNKEKAKKFLKKNQSEMRNQKERNKHAEESLNECDENLSLISGPKNELDYQRMKKEIKGVSK